MSGPLRVLLSLVIVAASLVVPASADAATCSTRPTGGLVTRRSGLDAYSIQVPDGIKAGSRAPLALMLHGLAAGSTGFPERTGWLPFGEQHDVIVAFPKAIAQTWLRMSGSPDVSFVRRVVADIRSTWCVDPHRIFVGGVSDGGFMAARLACDAADLFAAVAVVAGGAPGGSLDPCAPSEPVAVSFFHGTADKFVSIESAAKGRDAWVRRLRCDARPVDVRAPYGPLQRFRGCSEGVEVMWRVYNGAPHSWPKGERRDDAVARMWSFFKRTPD